VAFPWPRPRVNKFVALLLSATVVGGYIFLRVLRASISDIYVNALQFRLAAAQTGGMYFFRTFVIACVWLAFGVTLIFLLHRPRQHGFYRVVLVAIFLFMVAMLLATAQRSFLFIPLVSGVALLSLTGRKKISSISVMIAVPAGFILSYIYSVYRELTASSQGATADLLVQSISGLSFSDLLVQGAQSGSARLSYFASVVAAWNAGQPLLYGKSFLNLLWLLVPRSFFLSKPLYTDSYLTEVLYPGSSSGIAFTSLSELYINFGPIGIVLGGAVFGILLKILDNYIESERDNPTVQLWFFTAAIYLPLMVLGGLYSVTTIEAIFFSTLSILVGKALSWKKPRPQAIARAACKLSRPQNVPVAAVVPQKFHAG
jgi:oligosaccharide repeat unit polymerase